MFRRRNASLRGRPDLAPRADVRHASLSRKAHRRRRPRKRVDHSADGKRKKITGCGDSLYGAGAAAKQPDGQNFA